MPNDKSSVNGSESLSEETSETPSEQGNASSKSGGRTLENVLEENKRKADEIAELREQLNSAIAEKEERIAELQEKTRLTVSEKEEMESLEEQVYAIKRDKRSKPWLKVNQEISTAAAKSELAAYDAQMTEYRLEDMAETLGVSVDKFEKEIIPYMERVDPTAKFPGLMRIEKAFKLYKSEKSQSKKSEESKHQDKPYSDPGTTKFVKSQTRREILEGVKTKEGAIDVLKSIHIGQEEATSR